MDKKSILEAARKNKTRGCEYETKESARGSLLASAVSIFAGVILFLVEYFVKNSINVSMIAVWMIAGCVQNLYDGIKNSKVYMTIIGTIKAIIALLAIIIFIGQVVS